MKQWWCDMSDYFEMIEQATPKQERRGEVFTHSDDDLYECMTCGYVGSDWYETNAIRDMVEVDANMMLCPKCHSEYYYET